MAKVTYQCIFCKYSGYRKIDWISPKQFSSKATMQITFWCPSCEFSNTMTVQMMKDATIKVLRVQDTLVFLNGPLPEESSEEITARPKAGKGR